MKIKWLSLTNASLLLLMACLLMACPFGKKEPVAPQEQLVDPTNANALNEVLIMPGNAQEVQGTPPAPSASPDAPRTVNPISEINSSNGSTAPIPFSYNNVNGNLGGCYVQVVGANSYYRLPYSGVSGRSGSLSLPIQLPTNVGEGRFRVAFCVYDANGRISNVVYVNVNVLRLGTGALQISLAWTTATDQDLHVIDPTGAEIYYDYPYSNSGGELDRDDTDGYGPENIFWDENAPDGTYKVSVVDYDRTSTPNPFFVTINSPGKSKTFNGQTINGNRVQVVTFTKSGSTYSY